jgi:3-isopropylmalate/(R)-2-methylmalate dehydratase small subunit
MEMMRRVIITGTAISVRGNDIDTDRIIPARFLKCVVFDGLGEHAFEDDRLQLKQKGDVHPFDNPAHAGAEILFANKNFGCGSSREHAPQAIMRWRRGIKAIVGESFAEIFFGNCVALGIPCVTADEKAIRAMMDVAEANPGLAFTLDVRKMTVSAAEKSWVVNLPEGPRKQFLEGRWDSTAELMAAGDQIDAAAAGLPYFSHWR